MPTDPNGPAVTCDRLVSRTRRYHLLRARAIPTRMLSTQPSAPNPTKIRGTLRDQTTPPQRSRGRLDTNEVHSKTVMTRIPFPLQNDSSHPSARLYLRNENSSHDWSVDVHVVRAAPQRPHPKGQDSRTAAYQDTKTHHHRILIMTLLLHI